MKRLLVVDDNPDQLLLMELALRSSYNVTGCVSMGDFEQALERDRPDAILLDLHVGAHHASDFRAVLDRRGMKAPVVLVSGAVDIREQAQALGCVAALEKPYPLQALRAVLGRVLEPEA